MSLTKWRGWKKTNREHSIEWVVMWHHTTVIGNEAIVLKGGAWQRHNWRENATKWKNEWTRGWVNETNEKMKQKVKKETAQNWLRWYWNSSHLVYDHQAQLELKGERVIRKLRKIKGKIDRQREGEREIRLRKAGYLWLKSSNKPCQTPFMHRCLSEVGLGSIIHGNRYSST